MCEINIIEKVLFFYNAADAIKSQPTVVYRLNIAFLYFFNWNSKVFGFILVSAY